MRQIQQSLVSIKVGTSTIEKLVNAHEVPILQGIHGDDDRCVVLKEDAGVVASEASNEEELSRLMESYGKNQNIVFAVYRNAKDLGLAIGDVEYKEPKPNKAPKPKAEAVED